VRPRKGKGGRRAGLGLVEPLEELHAAGLAPAARPAQRHHLGEGPKRSAGVAVSHCLPTTSALWQSAYNFVRSNVHAPRRGGRGG